MIEHLLNRRICNTNNKNMSLELYSTCISRIFLLWLERRQEALAMSIIGGPIRGKALRGVNEGGVGRR